MSELSFDAPSLEKMGELLPSFEFEAKLKTTGHHAVYLATQKSLDRHVVIKIYSPSVTANPAFKQGFERSTQSIAKLNHVNLIGVFNSATVEGMAYAVMEFVEGRPLTKHMEAGKLSVPQATEIAKAMAAGVAYAHENQVLHGGLGVDNVFLNKKMEPKVGGFGFAIDTGDESIERFSAPELSEPSAVITPAVDVYSMGVILYEMVSGKTYDQSVRSLPTMPGVNPKLREVFKQAVAKDPDDRFKDAKAFASALDDAFSGGTGSASRVLAVGGKKPASVSRVLAVGGKKQASASKVQTGGGKAPAAPKRPAAAGQPLPSVGGGGMKLLRNIAIIALLLFAIKVAWNLKQSKEAKISEAPTEQQVIQARIVENAKARKIKQDRLARLAAEHAQEQEDREKTKIEPEPVVVVAPKNTLGSLGSLQESLLAGNRFDMPDGSVRMMEHEFLYVDKPMRWRDAEAFARAYGGYLAVPNLDATLDWLEENVLEDNDQGMWLGAAKSSHNKWTVVTGNSWNPDASKKATSGDGEYLASDGSGNLQALPSSELRPFIIQWDRDGKNSGSLENVLRKTKMTINDPNPVYPPGTESIGLRHYYFVRKDVTWQEAVDLAKSSGGHLAVSSGIAERFNLKKLAQSFDAENGIWYGGVYNDNQWQWVTGEQPWGRVKWAKGVEINQQGAALNVMPNVGWVPKDRKELASGFLIEWSKDAP